MRITLFDVCVYDGIVIFIIVIMCTHPMYSCADDGIHTPELEQQSHQSTPIFAIASVTKVEACIERRWKRALSEGGSVH